MSPIHAVSTSLFVLGAATGMAAQAAPKATTFTIRVENPTKGEILKLSNPLFAGGQPDAGKGLRRCRVGGGRTRSRSGASGLAR